MSLNHDVSMVKNNSISFFIMKKKNNFIPLVIGMWGSRAFPSIPYNHTFKQTNKQTNKQIYIYNNIYNIQCTYILQKYNQHNIYNIHIYYKKYTRHKGKPKRKKNDIACTYSIIKKAKN